MEKDKWAISRITALAILVDQISKYLITSNLQPLEMRSVISPWLNFFYAPNKGIAYGIVSEYSLPSEQIILAAFTGVPILLILCFLSREFQRDRLTLFAIALILGGATGNILDRIRLGHVVDFIDINIASWHSPTFNLADAMILFGLAVLLLRYPIHRENLQQDQLENSLNDPKEPPREHPREHRPAHCSSTDINVELQ